MAMFPVRTITLGIADPHPLSAEVIQRGQKLLQRAMTRFTDAGYEVQTTRISTRPLLEDLSTWEYGAILSYVQELQKYCDEANLTYCSLGTVLAARPETPLELLALLPDLLLAGPAMSITVQMATRELGLRSEVALPVAQNMLRLARETDEGMGNFRFAMLACVEPGSPFFPAAYHAGPTSLSIGLQGANIITEYVQSYVADARQAVYPQAITQWVRDALVEQVTPVVNIGQQLAQEAAVQFAGIDLSPAPMGPDSIATAMELCGYGPVGAPGTLTVAGAITAALKSTGLPTCGYCGLMLPILEDAGLSSRWEKGQLSIDQLLLYSSVCGTGLDTIPLPGNCSPETISAILLDVATMAVRLQKPLSARLFPVVGKGPGERTSFTSPYLTNTVVAIV